VGGGTLNSAAAAFLVAKQAGYKGWRWPQLLKFRRLYVNLLTLLGGKQMIPHTPPNFPVTGVALKAGRTWTLALPLQERLAAC